MRRPPVPRPNRRLRFQRIRKPFWRWRVWAVFPDGFEFPITRSGFWTWGGALAFAWEADQFRAIVGYDWRYEVRRNR